MSTNKLVRQTLPVLQFFLHKSSATRPQTAIQVNFTTESNSLFCSVVRVLELKTRD